MQEYYRKHPEEAGRVEAETKRQQNYPPYTSNSDPTLAQLADAFKQTHTHGTYGCFFQIPETIQRFNLTLMSMMEVKTKNN